MIYVNDQIFGAKTFMNGEVNFETVTLLDDVNTIRMKFRDNSDITNMMFAYQYIKEEKPESNVVLHLLYTPYSRMDRAINNQIFSLRLFAKMLATMDMSVVVIDPHSDVLQLEFDEAGVNYTISTLTLYRFIRRAYDISNPDIIMMPDKGAYAKYGPICLDALMYRGAVKYIHGTKQRDLENKGKIVGYQLECDGVDVKGKNVLIVDDICSFGGTALQAVQALKQAGAAEVHLYITHSELNIFKGKLTECEDLTSIITTDTVLDLSDKPATKVPVYILNTK